MFKITRGKGFHVKFENGYTVSVQFGPCNYCVNHDVLPDERPFEVVEQECGERGSPDAETAVISPNGNLIEVPGWPEDTVQGYMTPENMLQLMEWASKQPEEEPWEPDPGLHSLSQTVLSLPFTDNSMAIRLAGAWSLRSS